jgi:hypothetical protein
MSSGEKGSLRYGMLAAWTRAKIWSNYGLLTLNALPQLVEKIGGPYRNRTWDSTVMSALPTRPSANIAARSRTNFPLRSIAYNMVAVSVRSRAFATTGPGCTYGALTERKDVRARLPSLSDASSHQQAAYRMAHAGAAPLRNSRYAAERVPPPCAAQRGNDLLR